MNTDLERNKSAKISVDQCRNVFFTSGRLRTALAKVDPPTGKQCKVRGFFALKADWDYLK